MTKPTAGGAYWTTHLRAAEKEDVEFLIAQGLTPELAYKRVGVTPDTLAKRRQRKKDEG